MSLGTYIKNVADKAGSHIRILKALAPSVNIQSPCCPHLPLRRPNQASQCTSVFPGQTTSSPKRSPPGCDRLPFSCFNRTSSLRKPDSSCQGPSGANQPPVPRKCYEATPPFTQDCHSSIWPKTNEGYPAIEFWPSSLSIPPRWCCPSFQLQKK